MVEPTADDVASVLGTLSSVAISTFFSSKFGELLRKDTAASQNLERCLMFGERTWDELCRLLLPEPGHADPEPRSFPALERFCEASDLARKQFLLLPLVDPGSQHASLVIVCQPSGQPPQLAAAFGAQVPCILHLDSGLSAQEGGHHCSTPNFDALQSFLQQQYTKANLGHVEWAEDMTCSVPRQEHSGNGAIYLCTNALYFVATLPPVIDAEKVKELAGYKEYPKDLFPPESEAHYPGFLTHYWYPHNVPQSLRKLVLEGLQGHLPPSAESLQERVKGVQKALAKTSMREFQMPEQRRPSQEKMRLGRLLEAGRRHWAEQRGWTSGYSRTMVTCKPGSWSVQLSEHRIAAGVHFRDAEFGGSDKRPLPYPKPQQFEFCFGHKLRPGEVPPPFVVHISPDQLKPSVAAPASAVKREPVDPLNPSAAAPAPSVKVEAAEASKAPAGRQLEMSFYPKPEAQGWKLQKACWAGLRAALLHPLQPSDTLCFELREGGSGGTGTRHVNLVVQHAIEQEVAAEAAAGSVLARRTAEPAAVQPKPASSSRRRQRQPKRPVPVDSVDSEDSGEEYAPGQEEDPSWVRHKQRRLEAAAGRRAARGAQPTASAAAASSCQAAAEAWEAEAEVAATLWDFGRASSGTAARAAGGKAAASGAAAAEPAAPAGAAGTAAPPEDAARGGTSTSPAAKLPAADVAAQQAASAAAARAAATSTKRPVPEAAFDGGPAAKRQQSGGPAAAMPAPSAAKEQEQQQPAQVAAEASERSAEAAGAADMPGVHAEQLQPQPPQPLPSQPGVQQQRQQPPPAAAAAERDSGWPGGVRSAAAAALRKAGEVADAAMQLEAVMATLDLLGVDFAAQLPYCSLYSKLDVSGQAQQRLLLCRIAEKGNRVQLATLLSNEGGGS